MTLSDKLDHLFKVVHPARGEYTYEQVAAGIRERGIATVSGPYLFQLRSGARDNPTKRHLEAIADFFGVPVGYFFEDDLAARVDSQLELLASLRDAGVQHIATRSLDVSPEGRRVIADMVELIRRQEGLDRKPEGD